jgi:hypothetical protein
MINKPKYGTIIIINKNKKITKLYVLVTQWFLNEDKFYVAKEVKVPDESIYFRETTNNGWRRYNKYTVPKYNDTNGDIINFKLK